MLNRRKFIRESAFTAGALLGSSVLAAGIQTYQLVPSTDSVFLHGVASGDPSARGVVIWTRVSPAKEGPVVVEWQIATEGSFSQLIQSGSIEAGVEKDYTVKVELVKLSPATIYYYRFICGLNVSTTGRSKTTPEDTDENLKFAVVSCGDYAAGYFSAMSRIASKKDLTAVIHLGDYIYEGTTRSFASSTKVEDDEFESTHFNRTREWWLYYYRKRYSINRLDLDLQAAHKEHAFITVWDDHEIADNTWKGGAKNHDPEVDGDWEVRKSAAQQAYAEWIPIRGDCASIYRSIQFGQMAELVLLDTRLEGRNKQVLSMADPLLNAKDRTLLGTKQKTWLHKRLTSSACRWKIMASQVIFSEVNIKWAASNHLFTEKARILQQTLLDYWEGYPAEKDEIINLIQSKNISNVVILSASMHCSLAFDVVARPTNDSPAGKKATYDPVSNKGVLAVEFATPSLTSNNFDEKLGSFYANAFQSLLNKKLPAPFNVNPNPHLKFADLQSHGYFILELTKERAEATYYFVDHLKKGTTLEHRSAAWHTKSGKSLLQKSS